MVQIIDYKSHIPNGFIIEIASFKSEKIKRILLKGKPLQKVVLLSGQSTEVWFLFWFLFRKSLS